MNWLKDFRFSEELAIIGLVAIAIVYRDSNIALAIAGGLIGYLRGTSKSNGMGG